MRTVVRGPTAIEQAASTLLLVPRQPLVPDPPAHAVAGAELGHGKPVTQRVLDETNPLVHRGSLQPRHRRSSLNRESPRSLEGVVPMFLDSSVTYVSGPYRLVRLTSE